MRLIHALGAAGLMFLALSGGTQPSAAQQLVIYPWCAHYGGRNGGGAPNCGFTTVAQCMAAVSGTQGTCQLNPWYEPPLQPQARRRGVS